jgi:transcription termination factor Rho
MFEQPATVPTVTRAELERRHLAELHELGSQLAVPRFRTLRREALIEAILAAAGADPGARTAAAEETPAQTLGARTAAAEEPPDEALEPRAGVLDLVPDGYGFMRVEGLGRSDRDVYVARSQIRALGLRSGDELAGPVRPAARSERYPALAELETVNGVSADELPQERPRFDALTPVGPSDRLPIDSGGDEVAIRMLELLAPIARGQRCLIAGPPGAGATRLLYEIARALIESGGAAPLILLIDARPEEVTAWERTAGLPVQAAPSDRSPEAHVRLAELALERSKRIVERGDGAILLLDSITRLARARSLLRSRSKEMLDDEPVEGEGAAGPAARFAKRWFSAARSTEEGGSLTIIATARVGSGSPLEEAVYEALAGTTNMEVRLDRELARTGRFPAFDPNRCRTHAEEAIVGEGQLPQLRELRRSLVALPSRDAWELLAERIRATASNAELLARVEAQYG